ncbi:MAG: BMC domain-containing protein [Candidatus Eisenbacteria bacterium]
MVKPETPESIAAIESTTIHEGVATIDAMAKSARIEILAATPIPPGRFLIVVAGAVAEVEVAYRRGLELTLAPYDRIFLPEVAPDVLRAVRALAVREDQTDPGPIDSLGLFETRSVSAALDAADRGVKGSASRLLHLHAARGIAGKSIGLFEGRQDAVEAALDQAEARAEEHGAWVGSTLLARPDEAVARRLARSPWGFLLGQEVL